MYAPPPDSSSKVLPYLRQGVNQACTSAFGEVGDGWVWVTTSNDMRGPGRSRFSPTFLFCEVETAARISSPTWQACGWRSPECACSLPHGPVYGTVVVYCVLRHCVWQSVEIVLTLPPACHSCGVRTCNGGSCPAKGRGGKAVGVAAVAALVQVEARLVQLQEQVRAEV